MSVALAVKATMDAFIYEEDAADCSIEAYSNGREQGLLIAGPAGRAAFSENRNTDSIVVYVSRPAWTPGRLAFEMGGNIPNEQVYRNARYFDPDRITDAAQFILSMVTERDYGFASDRKQHTFDIEQS